MTVSRILWISLFFASLNLTRDAAAAVLVFDNSAGQFLWAPQRGLTEPGTLFSPILAPGDQTAAIPATSFRYSATFPTASDVPFAQSINAQSSSMRIARSPIPASLTNGSGVTFSTDVASTFAIGEPVGPTADWQSFGAVAWHALFTQPNLSPLLGSVATVGVRVQLADGFHYAFVDLEWRTEPFPMYQPIRWAYETEPNVPITVVPSPAAATFAAIAAVGLASRRRRRGAP